VKDPRSLKDAIQHCKDFGYGRGQGTTTGTTVAQNVRAHEKGKQELQAKLDRMRRHKDVLAEDREKIWGPIFARGAAYLKAHLDFLPAKYCSEDAMEPHLDEWLYNFALRNSAIKKGESTPRVRLFSRTREPKMFAVNWRPTKTRAFHRAVPSIWTWEDLDRLVNIWPTCTFNTTKHAPTVSEAFAKGVISSPFQVAQNTVQRWQFSGEPIITRYYGECVGQIFGDQNIPEMPGRTDSIPFDNNGSRYSLHMQECWESLRVLLFGYMNGTNEKGRNAITFIALQELNNLLENGDAERFDYVAHMLAVFDEEGKLDLTNRLSLQVQTYKNTVYQNTRGGDGNLISATKKKQAAKDDAVRLRLETEKQERYERAQANKQIKKAAAAAGKGTDTGEKMSTKKRSAPGQARKNLIEGDDVGDDEKFPVLDEPTSGPEADNPFV
jgi:hypothetical protein